jgi:hypothetical protein
MLFEQNDSFKELTEMHLTFGFSKTEISGWPRLFALINLTAKKEL